MWDWAGNEHRKEPEIVLASAGDIVTMETIAAAQLLRQHCPEFEFRVVNIVDLMALFPEARHPHGMGEGEFVDAFTADTDVVFAFHGTRVPSTISIHGRPRPAPFPRAGLPGGGHDDHALRHGRPQRDQPIPPVHRSGASVPRDVPVGAETLVEHCKGDARRHEVYIVEHLEDMPEVRDWRWSP